jgi:hypothetical protein
MTPVEELLNAEAEPDTPGQPPEPEPAPEPAPGEPDEEAPSEP